MCRVDITNQNETSINRQKTPTDTCLHWKALPALHKTTFPLIQHYTSLRLKSDSLHNATSTGYSRQRVADDPLTVVLRVQLERGVASR